MSAALKEEVSQKSAILEKLNNQQHEQSIKQKFNELEALSRENSKLQEVLSHTPSSLFLTVSFYLSLFFFSPQVATLAMELDAEKKNLQAINAALQMEEMQSKFPEKERYV